MQFIACGINHKTAPLTLREALAVSHEKHATVLKELAQQPNIGEALVLSTCNRLEFYYTAAEKQAIMPWLAERHGRQALEPHLYLHHENAAMQHLLRVTCGLDSMVIGEPQILGQVKQAYHTAKHCGTLGPRLEQVFQRAFAASKHIRHATNIGVNPLSIAHAAVQLAKQIFADIKPLTVLLIGSGQTISLVSKYLNQAGVTDITIANRSMARAKVLADPLAASCCLIRDIPSQLPHADIVFSATAAQLPIIGKGMVERISKMRKHKPLLMIDLALPRDIEPEVAELPDVFLYNIDDFSQIICQGLLQRQHAANQAEQIIALEVAEFQRQQQLRQAVTVLRQYREQISELAAQELQWAQRALQQPQADPLAIMQQFSQRLTNKALHKPTLKIRRAGVEDRSQLLQAIHFLFEN